MLLYVRYVSFNGTVMFTAVMFTAVMFTAVMFTAVMFTAVMFAGVSVVLRPFVEISSLPNDVLVQIPLYGDKNLSHEINKNILELTLVFIHNTGRFY